MSEIRRILLSRRTILCFFAAIFLGCIFFIYDCRSEKDITPTGEELTAYINNYPEFLQSVQANAENFGTIAVLSDGFSAKNIIKTAEDYNRLTGITPAFGENKGIVLMSDFIMGDFIIIGIVLFISASFIEEKRKGLTYLVRSTKNGRFSLSLQRTAIIAISSVTVSVILHTTLFLTAQLICGDMEIMRPLQSVPEFSLCPFNITILEYLIFSTLIKSLAAMISGLLIFFLSSVTEPAVAIILFGVTAAAEYSAFSFILPTDRLSPLKFCNIAALLRTDLFFKEYCNLNIFGNAVGFLNCGIIFGTVILIVLLLLCAVFTSGEKNTFSFGTAAADKISRFISRNVPAIPLGLWEMKKTFINQKGILILGAIAFIAVNSALQYRYLTPSYNKYELMYYDKYSGIITEETVNDIKSESLVLQAEYDELGEKYYQLYEDNGRIITEEMVEIWDSMKILDERLTALDKLRIQAESGLLYTAETGIKTEMIKTAVYELLLLNDKTTTSKNALYIILCIIGVFAGICTNENRSNMNAVLKASPCGRKKLTLVKLTIISVTAFVATIGLYLTQFLQIGEGGYNNLDSTAQSLEFLRFMPFEITIFGYFIMMFCVRIISAFIIGIFVMGVSCKCRSYVTSVCICAAVLVIPSVLSGTNLMGIPSAADFIGFSVL